MKKTLMSALLTVTASAAAPISAHNLVPDGWCLNGSSQILVEIHYTRNDLIEYKNTNDPVDLVSRKPCGTQVRCGVVDDWHWASQMMTEPLFAAASQRTSSASSPIAVVTTPDYNNSNHHGNYNFSDELHVRYLHCVYTQNNGG